MSALRCVEPHDLRDKVFFVFPGTHSALLIHSRVHCKSAISLPNVDKIIEFIHANSQIADKILICVRTNRSLALPDLPL
jgi:hypothetical protein